MVCCATSTLYGGAGADSFDGTATSSRVAGEAGNDVAAFTSISASTVLGGEGADSVGVNAVFVDSSIVGGAGNDTFNASSSTAILPSSSDLAAA